MQFRQNKLAIAISLALTLNTSHAQFSKKLSLSDLNGSNGIVISGVNASDYSGFSVSYAGDINGDGVDDLIIGATETDPNGNTGAGSSYVVFGSDAGLPNPLNLSTLDGVNGFVINGVNTEDRSGRSVSNAGDINGDGFDDLIIGVFFADPNGNSNAGSSYVIYGSDLGLPNPFNLSSINGVNGFVINGVNVSDRSGGSVSRAGDINGDGIDDLIIGAASADPNGNLYSGSSYVVFGSDMGLPSLLNLSSINGLNGFVINGANAGDQSGRTVSYAGDINGDGIDDLIIGAPFADKTTISGLVLDSGNSYVVFGSDMGLPNPFNLSSINGVNGFVINGIDAGDNSGASVSYAGDINGDGIDDLIIGAKSADTVTIGGPVINAGSSYVVFGNDTGLPNPFNLSALNGVNGFVINGINSGDGLGKSVSYAGDINGDGIEDLIIGAPYSNKVTVDGTINDSGSSYVVFGSSDGLPNPFNLSSINGVNGLVFSGVNEYDRSGWSVSFAGDFNSDGMDDLIIGAPLADKVTIGGTVVNSGKSYVVFDSDLIFVNGFEP